MLVQLWSLGHGTGKGIKYNSEKSVSILAGKSCVLPPQKWTVLYPPYKVNCHGHVTLVCRLTRKGTLSNLIVTAGGQLRIHVLNVTDETIQLTPRTVLVNVLGSEVRVQYFAEGVEEINMAMKTEITGETLKEEVISKFPEVGDLSQHPVKEPMRRLLVRSSEVQWDPPPECGIRTQYAVENVSDRRVIRQQLMDYIRRGYLAKVSVGEDIYMSPLLPIKKPNGTYRFTNDFRKLNTYFKSVGTSQVDVWRKIWEICPSWRFFIKIDLKDGFFGVPVDETLSHLFGFTFGADRFRWLRLPQG